MRRLALRSPLATLALLAATSAGSLGAQTVTFDFATSDGGFTRAPGYNTWGYRPPTQGGVWFTLEPLSIAVRLLSPVLYATGGTTTVRLTHEYNLDANGAVSPPLCRDAGLLRLATGGGAFVSRAPSGGQPYNGVIWDRVGNPDAGESGFCGYVGVGSPITTTWSFSAVAGTPFQLAFEAAFDAYSSGGAGSTWFLHDVVVSNAARTAGAPAAPILATPEPASWALLGVGVLAIGVAGRRPVNGRRRQSAPA